MKIGIIGAGNIGSTLATHFNRLDHEVWIANSRGPSTLSDLERRTGARGATVEDALAGAGLVVVTIPMKNVKELPKAAFALVPDSTIVVDTCNYYPDTRDGTIPELEGKIAESAYVETQIGHPVIKAFNNIMAPLLAKLPPHCVVLHENALPRGSRRGTPQTYGEVMALWERLHLPYLAAADMQVDPLQRIEHYRRTIRVDYACELAHQKLAQVAHELTRQR